ncbi:MAG: winged helix-turn-helix transcriptional regulator [Clostridiales bacterium]|nr:winged helix-turn-helix transcriptional regulator [Clostridiales bacterium]
MLKDRLEKVYDNFKLSFYMNVFNSFEQEEETLTLVEIIACEVIYLFENPTISELSNFMGVSQPNMTYRVNSLVKKGYVKKKVGKSDRRETRLELTDKFLQYEKDKSGYIGLVSSRVEERFSKEEVDSLNRILETIAEELMPECRNPADS